MSKKLLRSLIGAGLIGLSLLLSACGDTPEKMVASAKAAIDKHDFTTAAIQIKNALQKDPSLAEARFLFGRVLMAQGDYSGAERELRKAKDDGYSEAEVLPVLISSMLFQGQAQKAIAEFSGKQPKDPAARAALSAALGDAYLSLQDTDSAAKFYSAALSDASDTTPALMGQAQLLMVKQDTSGALAAVNKVLDTHPKLVDAYVFKSDILIALGRTDEAVTNLREVAKIAPEDKMPLFRLVSIFLGQDKNDEAAKVMEGLRKLAPNDSRTVYFDGVLALRANKFTEARDAANKILRALPNHVLAQVLAATANLRLGDTLQAENLLQKVIAQRGNWVLPRRLLAQAYLMDKDGAHAVEAVQPMLDADTKDAVTLNLAAEAYMQMGNYEKASDYFSRVAKISPESSQAHARLGMARIAGGDEAAGIQELETAAQRNSGDMLAQVGLISTYLKKGDVAKAKQAVDTLEKSQPNNPGAFNIKGFVMLAMKDKDGARKAFERAVELQADNIAAVTQLARIDISDGKPADARARFEKLIKAQPKNIRAYVLLAQMLDETKAPAADVRAVYERGVNADANSNDARLPYVLWLLRNSDNKTALSVAQAAAAAQPASAEAQRLLARTNLAVGDKNQALSIFTKLQADEPNNPTALVELADAQSANGDIASAEKSLRSAISIKPDAEVAYERLAALLTKDARVGEILPVAKDLQKYNPKSTTGYLLEADAQIALRKFPEAVTAMQTAYGLAKTPKVALGLRRALLMAGKTADAQALTNDWLKRNPDDVVMRAAMADEALTAGKYADALAQYKALDARAPNSIVILNNMTWTANKLSDPKAMEYADRLYKLAPQIPAIMETVGTTWVDHGQAQRGIELIRKALDIAPEAAAVRLGYARALAKTGDKGTARSEANKALENLPQKHPLRDEINAFLQSLG